MLSDALLNFAVDEPLNTGAAASYMIGDQVDLGVAARGVGSLSGHQALWLVITVDTAATSGGAATGTFQVVTDSDPAFGSPTVVATTTTIPVASMTASGAEALAVLPFPTGAALERYIGLRQVTGTAAFTGGVVTAVVTHTPPQRFHYAQGAGASLDAS